MSNRLANETSPYLLQHKDNPVAWYPWSAEALGQAKAEDKPIFLSIGYSACHWCHVMEHESFENDEIAKLLNDNFISIKVDREERPDLDQIYMTAVQMMTGRGGWPMSVFLTSDLEPFYGGTYWPPQPRMGMPGFGQVLSGVLEAWRNRRDQLVEQAAKLTDVLRQHAAGGGAAEDLDMSLLLGAEAELERIFDYTYGGFGGAPKFPHPMNVRLLMRMWHRNGRRGLIDMVTQTLERMAAGGIYDHLGGGFHRYSVDARWLVPHFEKMLYDNALLAGCYLEAHVATGNADYARVTRETLDYVIREMQHPDGGYYSTQDADSEGVEGKFFVWTPAEVREVLGMEAAETFCRVYDVTDSGNFERTNILNLPKPIAACAKILNRDEADLRAELAASRQKLFDVRERRVHPGLDDKVLVSWNGLMIDSMATAAGVLDEPRYLASATAAAEFMFAQMCRGDGRLLHTWRSGVAKLDAYLDDYASLINALVSLYEAGFDERWIDRGVALAEILLQQFHDADLGGFFFTAADHEQLITRQKDLTDNAVPSGSALAATGLLRLGKLTGRGDLLAAAVGTLRAAASHMKQHAMATGQMLLALDFHLGPTPEVVITWDGSMDEAAEILAQLRRRYLPRKVVACRTNQADRQRSNALSGLFAGKQPQPGQMALFVCENFGCQKPILGKAAAITALNDLGRGRAG
jgi:uncharacterized protein YyaL (SSP411 family)